MVSENDLATTVTWRLKFPSDIEVRKSAQSGSMHDLLGCPEVLESHSISIRKQRKTQSSNGQTTVVPFMIPFDQLTRRCDQYQFVTLGTFEHGFGAKYSTHKTL